MKKTIHIILVLLTACIAWADTEIPFPGDPGQPPITTGIPFYAEVGGTGSDSSDWVVDECAVVKQKTIQTGAGESKLVKYLKSQTCTLGGGSSPPTAGTYIDVSGTTVSVDSTEIHDVTFGDNTDTFMHWIWDVLGSDVAIDISENLWRFLLTDVQIQDGEFKVEDGDALISDDLAGGNGVKYTHSDRTLRPLGTGHLITNQVVGTSTLPATCVEGEIYQDTDSGNTELHICTATNTWKKLEQQYFIGVTEINNDATQFTVLTGTGTGFGAWGQVNLSSTMVNGVLPITKGGTGSSTEIYAKIAGGNSFTGAQDISVGNNLVEITSGGVQFSDQISGFACGWDVLNLEFKCTGAILIADVLKNDPVGCPTGEYCNDTTDTGQCVCVKIFSKYVITPTPTVTATPIPTITTTPTSTITATHTPTPTPTPTITTTSTQTVTPTPAQTPKYSANDLSTNIITHQWSFGFTVSDVSVDLTAFTNRPILVNKARDVTITKVCCYADLPGVTIAGRKIPHGVFTPAPTPALPTPAVCATPGFLTADAGCITGLSFTIPKDSELQMSVSAVVGNKTINYAIPFTVDDD